MVRADTRADVNNLVKRTLDVRKASFLATERAVEETGMEYGGITPVGLPAGWRLLVDASVLDIDVAVIGSGVRQSKALPGHRDLAEVCPGWRSSRASASDPTRPGKVRSRLQALTRVVTGTCRFPKHSWESRTRRAVGDND